MKKLKIPFIVLSVVVAILITSSCKKPDLDISWYSMEGSGLYNSQDNTSVIKLLGFVEFGTPQVATEVISAQIIAWEFVVREGEQMVLFISSENYYSELGDLFINKSQQQTDFLWVTLQTTTPKSGDIFNGANPDTFQLTFWITDDNGNSYVMSNTAEFEFSRD